MKMYKVNVNGNLYEITLEVVDAAEVKTAPKAAAPAAAPAAPVAAGDGQKITAPMPGTILKVNVQNGQSVKNGQVLLVLEAMKMENEIVAPCDGVVTSVTVTKGASVTAGAVLCTLK